MHLEIDLHEDREDECTDNKVFVRAGKICFDFTFFNCLSNFMLLFKHLIRYSDREMVFLWILRFKT